MQTDSEVAEPVKTTNDLVQEFITKHNIHTDKHFEQPWGSYCVKFSVDGNVWFAKPPEVARFFGWGWSVPYAVAEVLIDVIKEGVDQQFIDFFGLDRVEELKTLVGV